MAKSAIIHEVCPIAQGINILSGKWKLQIIWFLSLKQTTRFNELQKSIGNITTTTRIGGTKSRKENNLSRSASQSRIFINRDR